MARARSYRKSGRRPRRKSWKRRIAKKAGKGDGVRYMKLRNVISLNTDGSGEAHFDLAVRNPSGAQDWSSCSALFDSYRVCAYKLQFIPHLPNGSSQTADYRPMYITYDNNSTISPISSINASLQYENLVVKNLFRPWKHYLYVPKSTDVGTTYGYSTCALPNDSGRLTLLANNLDFSGFYGDIIITYYCKFKERR